MQGQSLSLEALIELGCSAQSLTRAVHLLPTMTSPVEPDAPLAMSISDDENELQLDGGGSAPAAAAAASSSSAAAAAAPVGDDEETSDSDDDGEAPARRSRVS